MVSRDMRFRIRRRTRTRIRIRVGVRIIRDAQVEWSGSQVGESIEASSR